MSDFEGFHKRSRFEPDRSLPALDFDKLADARLCFLSVTADVFEVRFLRFPMGLANLGVHKSYIGGLHQDQGIEAVRSWLRPLLLPDAFEAYRIVRKEYGLPPLEGVAPAKRTSALAQLSANTPFEASRSMWFSPPPGQYSTNVGHLALFNQHLQQESKPVEWVYTDSAGEGSETTPVWVCIFLAGFPFHEHELTFLQIVQAMVDGDCVGCGRGNTKKAAKNEAAKEGLAKLGVEFVRRSPHPFCMTPVDPEESRPHR